MARYPQGQSVRLGGSGLPITIRDATGALANASATLITLQKPDGTVQTYTTPVNDSTGLYHFDIPQTDLALLGHYQWIWDATVGGFHAITTGELDMFDPLEVTVLPLQDAKDALNIPQTNSSYDAEIMRKLATIEASIERIIGGPVVNRPVVERVEITNVYASLLLRKRPVVSVTSIVSTATGTNIPITDLEIDTTAGIIRRKLGWPFLGPFFTWTPVFTVTYVAGWGTSVPPAIADAAADILDHIWTAAQRGESAAPQFGAEQTTLLPGMGYAIPNVALEKLAPYTLEAYV